MNEVLQILRECERHDGHVSFLEEVVVGVPTNGTLVLQKDPRLGITVNRQVNSSECITN